MIKWLYQNKHQLFGDRSHKIPHQDKKNNNTAEYDQEMPQSQTIDQRMAPRGRDKEYRQSHDSWNTFQ